jgi:pantoate--beta-alanine ligase
METLHDIGALRARVADWRRAGERIALVPTMGNLHAAHLDLVDRARARCDRVVVSIFVNPLQFGQGEDFTRYPRTLAADGEKLSARAADLVFAPTEEAVYPRGRAGITAVHVPEIEDMLCGAHRPGHFSGVATVVAILFNLVRPHLAVFGEKDFQQLLVIRRMVADLHMPVEVVAAPTVREPDGLAMSSRNAYLSAEQRERAPLLYRTLQDLRAAAEAGRRDFPALQAQALERLEAAGFRPDYVAVRRAQDLGPPQAHGELVVLAAAWLGRARLIDNLTFRLS